MENIVVIFANKNTNINKSIKISYYNYARPKAFKPDIIAEQNGVCGMKPEWNGKPLVFILDHGHASHNERSNLRCICPNCDSQLDTYKSKNKCGEDPENKIGK